MPQLLHAGLQAARGGLQMSRMLALACVLAAFAIQERVRAGICGLWGIWKL
jgi:hypothetical protein